MPVLVRHPVEHHQVHVVGGPVSGTGGASGEHLPHDPLHVAVQANLPLAAAPAGGGDEGADITAAAEERMQPPLQARARRHGRRKLRRVLLDRSAGALPRREVDEGKDEPVPPPRLGAQVGRDTRQVGPGAYGRSVIHVATLIHSAHLEKQLGVRPSEAQVNLRDHDVRAGGNVLNDQPVPG